MRKFVRPLLALALTAVVMPVAHALDTGYANDAYAARISMDAFGQSVKKRLQAVRVGSSTQYFGSAPVLFQSDDAYAMAPSSRSSSVAAGASRRQLDCVYYNGFTVWGDFYSTWAKQNGNSGYRFNARGPAIGVDWSNGPLVLGIATTYNWGKLRNSNIGARKTRTWAVEIYGQYDIGKFYGNATAAYGNTHYKGNNTLFNKGSYNDDAWNFDVEFGYKFGSDIFKVVPNVGFRYFHDRANSISSSWAGGRNTGSRRFYNVFELPVGVDISSQIAVGGALLVPRARFAWIPELGRKRGGASGSVYDTTTNPDTLVGHFSDNSSRRGRHGFQIGAGLEAKITKAISAHVDYNVILRRSAWEQRINAGLGFTF